MQQKKDQETDVARGPAIWIRAACRCGGCDGRSGVRDAECSVLSQVGWSWSWSSWSPRDNGPAGVMREGLRSK